MREGAPEGRSRIFWHAVRMMSGMTVTDDVRKLSRALLEYHKMLIDAARDEYVRAHGIALTPAALLELLMGDPSFRWLQPLTQAIVAIDEGVANKDEEAMRAGVEKAGELLTGTPGDPTSLSEQAKAYAEATAAIGAAGQKVRELLGVAEASLGPA
jgi:hypothetical protein